jgi:hypothetical protein
MLSMFTSNWKRDVIRVLSPLIAIGAFLTLGSVLVADLNPAALSFTLPDKIKWVENPNGAANAVMVGDPNKPGLYIVLNKWHPHHMSRPHFHPNDRFITVLQGTWFVGTGPKYDPASTVGMPAGTFVKHTGMQIHYDGAKDEECLIEIVGMGPATSTDAEQK